MNQGILAGTEIAAAVERGDIVIDPFRPEQLNPASYDVTLGDEVCVYASVVSSQGNDPMGRDLYPLGNADEFPIDAKKRNETLHFKMSKDGLLLKPGIGYLLHTVERIRTDKFVPIVDGKSSIGRLFITVHVTAGYGDPGFDGQYTLETVVTHPVIIYPGMRIGQMRFHTLVGEPRLYGEKGHYTGEASRGPVPSQSHKQFK